MSICKSCGKELESEAKFCPYCGAKNDQGEKIKQSESTQAPHKWHFEKPKFMGMVITRRIKSDITLADDLLHITVTGSKEPQNIVKSVFNLISIDKKNSFDRWNFVLTLVLGMMTVFVLLMGEFLTAIIGVLATPILLNSCYYINVRFLWADGIIANVQVKNRNKAAMEEMIHEINQIRGRQQI